MLQFRLSATSPMKMKTKVRTMLVSQSSMPRVRKTADTRIPVPQIMESARGYLRKEQL